MTHESYTPDYPQHNTAGIVGFVISLMGLFSAGLLSPIGLIVSMMGLTKTPRGFAVAGVIIGLIGSLELVIMVLVITAIAGAGMMVFLMVMFFQNFGVEGLETFADTGEIMKQIVLYEDENGTLPQSIGDLTLEDKTLTDYWGNPYVITMDQNERTITITTYGEDGRKGGDSDLTISLPFDFVQDEPNWEEMFDDKIEIISGDEEDTGS
ncbi:MAG: DUF4190 domain-containing protein [Planctomycetota bacterium]|jgi:hypothetical protein